ncbi:MAG: methylenetetrahydrofolate reductase [NAD(P)H] [Lachnospiraceae bacterium]|nr:methylenetetrahydrofolate reductase [NAD(P)H] [Lachnospiraceae bacterium]
MKIIDILKTDRITLSFEVFPPKTEDKMDVVIKATEEIARLSPDFMSVTYGAGGGTSEYTAEIADRVQREMEVPMLAHLTCVSSSREHVKKMIGIYKERGIENIMALRGDIPKDGTTVHDYKYATDLIADIKDGGDFCIGGACYPEGHPEAESRAADLKNLKRKVDAGVDFLTTQMFFDNEEFFDFMYRLREADIQVPVLAGIMPITNAKMMKRSIEMSGTKTPRRFLQIIDFFEDRPDALRQAGIIYATEQIIDLIAHGVKNIHVYSMNKPDVARDIQNNLSEIIK